MGDVAAGVLGAVLVTGAGDTVTVVGATVAATGVAADVGATVVVTGFGCPELLVFFHDEAAFTGCVVMCFVLRAVA